MATVTAEKKRCFVVMGFGLKTDLATGRRINMDKTYKLLIKPTVESVGLECVRADEIRHTGVIDVPMYQELLSADVVVADLSTANLNATYELGVRHALRPWTTVVISENKLAYPFDVNHIAITSYALLDGGIDFEEVERFRGVLAAKLRAVMGTPTPDSPVYTFLNNLTPPRLMVAAAAAGAAAGAALERGIAAPPDLTAGAPPVGEKSLSELIEDGEQAIKDSEFSSARKSFAKALDLTKPTAGGKGDDSPDPYLLQRLALATYKAGKPDAVSALNEALAILEPLNPHDSNDPETAGLCGAIEKRLFESGQGSAHLASAIKYYARGYLLRDDYYNGINLAYLTNLRADTDLDPTDSDRIADLVYANRIRREVLVLCDAELRSLSEREERRDAAPPTRALDPLKREFTHSEMERKFWCLATKAEAHYGLGEMNAYREAKDQAYAIAPTPADWMKATLERQIGQLDALLTKHGRLLTPPWPGPAAAAG